MQPFTLFAPAKVNLALHVLGRRVDGYHDLDSIVAFADVGDRLTLTPEGEKVLATLVPAVHELRHRMLDPLTPAERAEFARLLTKFVQLNNEQSRAPLQPRKGEDA